MRAGLAVLFFPIVLLGGPPRFARIGDLEGPVEVQIRAGDPWISAVRNLPVTEFSRLRTSAGSRLEVELDDYSALRLAGDSLAEISDYTRLSTGQRITLISLDHGLVYFTGEPRVHDALSLALPGAQITCLQGSRVRLEARENWSQVAVLEGSVRFSMPNAEMDLRPGQIARVDLAAPDRFVLSTELPHLDSDAWSLERDKVSAHSPSAAYLPAALYGLVDLDRNGAWIQTSDNGPVWKPKVPAEWSPFHDGKWIWYGEIGYTWLPKESWAWTPSHYGRWQQDSALGWVWVPDSHLTAVFRPGDVYWLRGAGFVGWGPLAANESWTGAAKPLQFSAANTTLAKFTAGAKEIDPEGFAPKSKELLAASSFQVAPISPQFDASRFDASRPPLRSAGVAMISSASPAVPGVTYEPAPPVSAPAPVAASSGEFMPLPAALTNESSAPPIEPDTYYPEPIYTGIIIVNPPERGTVPLRHDHSGLDRGVAAGRSFAPEPSEPIHRTHPGDGEPAHPVVPAPPAHETPKSAAPPDKSQPDPSKPR